MAEESKYREAPETRDSQMSGDAESAIRMLANSLHRLNEAVAKCVDAGLTVELMRTARYHNEAGSWGDQLTPIIKQKG